MCISIKITFAFTSVDRFRINVTFHHYQLDELQRAFIRTFLQYVGGRHSCLRFRGLNSALNNKYVHVNVNVKNRYYYRYRMGDYVRLEEIIDVPRNSTMPYASNTNDIRQSSGLLMTHSSTATQPAPSISIRGFNFSARTMEHSRIFANNISSTIEEIRPLIEHVRVVSAVVPYIALIIVPM